MTDHICCEHAGYWEWKNRHKKQSCSEHENHISRSFASDYLDGAIRVWRATRDGAATDAERKMAECYIDAFQSCRISLLGELLPED